MLVAVPQSVVVVLWNKIYCSALKLSSITLLIFF